MKRADAAPEEATIRGIIERGGLDVYGISWVDSPFLPCDQVCMALKDPEELDEALKTVEHYKKHSYLSGCAHGR